MTPHAPDGLSEENRALVEAHWLDQPEEDDSVVIEIKACHLNRLLNAARSEPRSSSGTGESGGGWRPIETAPKDGRMALVFRPLARKSGDEPVAIKRLGSVNHHCWASTVPQGAEPYNPTTDGSCHVTHWQPLPAAPTQPNEASNDQP